MQHAKKKYQAMIDHLSSDIAEGIEDIQDRLDSLSTRSSSATNPNLGG